MVLHHETGQTGAEEERDSWEHPEGGIFSVVFRGTKWSLLHGTLKIVVGIYHLSRVRAISGAHYSGFSFALPGIAVGDRSSVVFLMTTQRLLQAVIKTGFLSCTMFYPST